MTISSAKTLAAVGASVVLVGLLVGFWPVRADGVGCGRPLTGQSSNALTSDFFNAKLGLPRSNHAAACRDAMSSRRLVTWAALMPGGALALAGFVALRRQQPASQP